MQTILMIEDKVLMTIFQIVYEAQAQKVKWYPSFLALLLFEIILNAEDQNIEFDNPDKKRLI